VFDDWASSRVETISEEDAEIFPCVSAAAIKTDTSEKVKSWLKRKK
jgi:hypothetical protein